MSDKMVLAGPSDRNETDQWRRDLDLAALVEMPQPRDIRPVIRKAIEDHAIFPEIICAGGARADQNTEKTSVRDNGYENERDTSGAGATRARDLPQYRELFETVVSGMGREQTVPAFELNTAACFVILGRLRRPEAEALFVRAVSNLARERDAAVILALEARAAAALARAEIAEHKLLASPIRGRNLKEASDARLLRLIADLCDQEKWQVGLDERDVLDLVVDARDTSDQDHQDFRLAVLHICPSMPIYVRWREGKERVVYDEGAKQMVRSCFEDLWRRQEDGETLVDGLRLVRDPLPTPFALQDGTPGWDHTAPCRWRVERA